MKKNAKGVRGIKLGRTESLEAIHLLDGTEDDPIVMPPACGWYVERIKEYKNNCHIFICKEPAAGEVE